MKITILGCGASGGVPLIGCRCAVCCSDNIKNKRLRSSVVVEVEEVRLLIDSSPDMREQLMRSGLYWANAVLYTHGHADHTHGVDDLRAFNFHRNCPLPVYGSADFFEEFEGKFPYAFTQKHPETGWHRPYLVKHTIQSYDDFSIEGVSIQSFLQHHGKGQTLGYRIGNFAYSTDVNNLPQQSLQLLESLDVWVVDCLRRAPAPTHAHLAMTLDWIATLKPKRAILTHMSHDLEYEWLTSILPDNVQPAYDGMVIEL